MPERKRSRGKKYFTVEQANQMLPLVKAIVRDIVSLAQDLHARDERLRHIRPSQQGSMGAVYQEEYQQAKAELAREAARLEEFRDELRNLGVALKGLDGLVDFPCWMDGREVYLCWKLGEPEVAHWHEVEAGFAGRQKLLADAAAGHDGGFGAAER